VVSLEGVKYEIVMSSIEVCGVLKTNKGFREFKSQHIPYKYLPFLYFLSRDDLEDTLSSCLDIESYDQININFDKLFTILKGRVPTHDKPEF
jgi:hypothetical protein